jgi:lipoate-protein ligase A
MLGLAEIKLTLPELSANLALDEALLLAAEAGTGGECLRLWHWPTLAVVLGAGGSVNIDVDTAACAADGVPIARRSSGGGTVLLGPGCLCFSLILRQDRAPELREIRSSYAWILGRLVAMLAPLVPDVRSAGISDLSSGGRKFSGNAQQRKRTHLLHHGTLLYAANLAQIPQYLRPPEREPDYRAGRTHTDFVCNLPTSADHLRHLLRTTWGGGPPVTQVPHDQVAQLVNANYSRHEWIYRR